MNIFGAQIKLLKELEEVIFETNARDNSTEQKIRKMLFRIKSTESNN